MPYIKHRVHLTLLLSIFLSSCLGNSQPAQETSVSPALTPIPTQTIFHIDRSTFSYGIFETEATSVLIDVYNTTPDRDNAFADVSIEDGSDIRIYKLQSGESRVIHTMPAGKKHVTITSGGQVKLNGEIRGVFIDKITFDKPAVPIRQPNKQVVVYGDSLAAGGRVDNPSAEAWPVLVRKHHSVTIDAYGYRMLYDDASTPAERSKFASRLASGTPDFIWLAIGTNDYGFEQWSAREFGEAYAATLDAIHSLSPQAILFAQSPILRADESANVFGNSLEDYRQQIAAPCLARSDWCVFVDGTNPAFPQPNELHKDGIHLTTASSEKYAEAVLDIIGK